VGNLLGDLDLGLESYWGSTEIEMNVQLPTCDMIARHKDMRLNPDCSWKNVHVYHWIKIVMRISRPDPEDPTGQRRRHFEISIDSPFTVLNCRATQANTSLPEYSGRENCLNESRATMCGCPDSAAMLGHGNSSPNSSTPALAVSRTDSASPTLPAPPQAAHLAAASPQTPSGDVNTAPQSMGPDTHARPIHLMRVPSYNPPAFDAEEPPPALEPAPDAAVLLMTPPPLYDVIIGTPSVDGMADYFARLADYGFDPPDDDSDSMDDEPARAITRNGRVTVANPRTPGGRRVPSRSMEIDRPLINLSLDAPQIARVDTPTPTVAAV